MASTNGVSDFNTIPEAIEAIRAGDFIVVLDSESRENEGDLIIAASDFTPSKAAFMIRHTSGFICASLPAHLAAQLSLPQMVSENMDPNRTAYTITIDAADSSVTTGISAHDRSLTCRLLAEEGVRKEMFRRPGHVVPLQAREGGVRVRPGHTEAAGDFARLAGKGEVGVLCELVEDGEEVVGRGEREGAFGMMRRDGCLAFARKFGLVVVTIEHLVRYLDETNGRAKG